MFKIHFNISIVKVAKIIHVTATCLIVLSIILLGHELYENFYLPYSLTDAPIVSTVSVQENPDTKLLNDTVEQLKTRQTKATTTIHINDIFWPKITTSSVSTSTKP